ISNADCLSTADRGRRFEMLKDAVARLKSRPGTSVYVDAGHTAWQPAAVAASRLIEAGIAQADGFSLNVSNFETTASNLSYGVQISALVGGKHFVIDTSRNGLGPGSTWCNPAGRALGSAPTTRTGHPRVDALLWVKRPGESDGDCNGGPSAGLFWADYALAMAQRTSSAMLAASLGSPSTAN
ncbi:MAG: glycoside hydrolase family 6 protein, partial [Gemmatimonadota bacterium]